MVNYEVDAKLLEPRVPPGTRLDFWGGRCFASLVGFQFLDTRLLGLPVPFHRNFDEVNLRFYVRREVGGEVRRGVVFIRELVPRHAIALVARAVYNEPYIALPMRHTIAFDPVLSAAYSWRLNGRWHRITVTAQRSAAHPAAGSLEEFITEHYWGYTRQRDGSTLEYQVTHPQWTVSDGAADIDADLSALYGAEMAAHLQVPASCFIAQGSAVTVLRPRRLPR
ncbi:MAG: uncharacterized protein QOC81_3324 [Thermoanaerobaculia bacterium]|jgi:uncharacterized protein YqjF (DUF2071 family)|nr:uncharacterized protein [Thermoanaerobaculia bacterium]